MFWWRLKNVVKARRSLNFYDFWSKVSCDWLKSCKLSWASSCRSTPCKFPLEIHFIEGILARHPFYKVCCRKILVEPSLMILLRQSWLNRLREEQPTESRLRRKTLKSSAPRDSWDFLFTSSKWSSTVSSRPFWLILPAEKSHVLDA